MKKGNRYRFDYTESSNKNTVTLTIVFYGNIYTTESNLEDRFEVEGIEEVIFEGKNIVSVYEAHDENALDGIEKACRQHLYENDHYGVDKQEPAYH